MMIHLYGSVVIRMRAILLCYTLVHTVSSFDYCSITCQGVGHTMCQFPAGGGPACRAFHRGLTNEEKSSILFWHNRLRQRAATGREPRRQLPPASDMMELVWDQELETIAQRWADQCYLIYHDQCRIAKDGSPVGQNMAAGWMIGWTPDRKTNISGWINAWYSEDKYFRSVDISPFRVGADFIKTGHYTQLVWAATSKVGCGLVEGRDKSGVYRFKFVCNYGPAGNMVGMDVYKQGRPCSNCPQHTSCSRRWPGLCAAI